MASVNPRPRKDGSSSFRLNYRLDGRPGSPVPFEDEAEANHWKKIFDTFGAREALRMLEASLAQAAGAAGDDMTVRQLVEKHIGGKTGVEKGTVDRYREEAERDIYPYLGDRRLSELDERTAEDIVRGWVQALERKPAEGRRTRIGLAPKTIKNRRGLLSGALNDAVRWGLIPVNPCSSVAVKDSDDDEMIFLENDEFWTLHDSMAKFWRPVPIVLVGTGARISEAFAFQCRDVDLKRNRIRVARAWKWHQHNSQRYLGPPKGDGKRWIPLLDDVAEVVEPLIHRRDPDDFLLRNTLGGHMRYSTFHGGPWTKALDKAALTRRPSPHALRHTFAAWQLGSGLVSIYTLSEVMGHDSVDFTAKKYGHLLPKALQDMQQVGSAAMRRQGRANLKLA